MLTAPPTRRHHVEKAIGVVTGFAALPVIPLQVLGLAVGASVADVVSGDTLKFGLAAWAVIAGYSVYCVLALRLCGLLLSTWGYVWRAYAVVVVIIGMHKLMSWIYPWEIGLAGAIFIMIASPWILGWWFSHSTFFNPPKRNRAL